MAILTAVLLWGYKNLPEPVIVAAAAVIGLTAYPQLHTWSHFDHEARVSFRACRRRNQAT